MINDLERAVQLVKQKVKVDGIDGYTCIGFKYYGDGYINVIVSVLGDNGTMNEFDVDIWRVDYNG